METDSYSANQRRAINLVWTACGDYQFEPQFLALKADGTPDFYMNCVIGLVRKWLGDEMPRRLFALWADDTRRSAFDDLAWLALENAVYEKELPVRPVLTELRRAHAAEFFASEYQLSRQEWMDKNQLVYSLQSARWRSVLGQKPPLLAPWEKGLSEALACPGTLDADDLEAAVRAAFEKYLQFDGTPHKKSPFRLHFSDRWAPLLTKLLPVEIVRTDELTVGRSAVAGENGMVRASNALRAQLRSNEREAEDHDYIERCFGRSLYSPQALARIEQRCCTGDHLGCHLWFTRGERVPGQPMRADTQRLFELPPAAADIRQRFTPHLHSGVLRYGGAGLCLFLAVHIDAARHDIRLGALAALGEAFIKNKLIKPDFFHAVSPLLRRQCHPHPDAGSAAAHGPKRA